MIMFVILLVQTDICLLNLAEIILLDVIPADWIVFLRNRHRQTIFAKRCKPNNIMIIAFSPPLRDIFYLTKKLMDPPQTIVL